MDAAEGDLFVSAIQGKLQPGTRAVTVDLAALDAIELGGVRSVLRLGRSLTGEQRSLDFLAGGPAVRHAFEHAGFADLFAFTPALHAHRGHHDAETS